jgi:hypothetical protein
MWRNRKRAIVGPTAKQTSAYWQVGARTLDGDRRNGAARCQSSGPRYGRPGNRTSRASECIRHRNAKEGAGHPSACPMAIPKKNPHAPIARLWWPCTEGGDQPGRLPQAGVSQAPCGKTAHSLSNDGRMQPAHLPSRLRCCGPRWAYAGFVTPRRVPASGFALPGSACVMAARYVGESARLSVIGLSTGNHSRG